MAFQGQWGITVTFSRNLYCNKVQVCNILLSGDHSLCYHVFLHLESTDHSECTTESMISIFLSEHTKMPRSFKQLTPWKGY
jgi:hypothetical protein